MEIESFLQCWKAQKHCTDATIRAYRNDLNLFARFMRQDGIARLNQVDHAVITRYIQTMKQASLADATVARRLAALSSYFSYVRGTNNPRMRNPFDSLTCRWDKASFPKPVDASIADRLIAGITNQRDRVLIILLLSTGLRVSEIQQLDRNTIKFESSVDSLGAESVGGVGEVVGKGNKKRFFYVDELTLNSYADYVASRTDEHPALFLSERKQRMSVRAIQYTLSAWCRKLDLPNINVHRLRHTFATRLANAGIDSLVLMKLMGHSSFETTRKYTDVENATVARGYFAAAEYLRK